MTTSHRQIVEIEGYLDRRMDIAKRREADMMVLDEVRITNSIHAIYAGP